MKYQHILNGKLLFETDDSHEFMFYLMTNDKAKQAKYSVLYNLLKNSSGYICNMSSIGTLTT
jgi:hypothetical protein